MAFYSFVPNLDGRPPIFILVVVARPTESPTETVIKTFAPPPPLRSKKNKVWLKVYNFVKLLKNLKYKITFLFYFFENLTRVLCEVQVWNNMSQLSSFSLGLAVVVWKNCSYKNLHAKMTHLNHSLFYEVGGRWRESATSQTVINPLSTEKKQCVFPKSWWNFSKICWLSPPLD